MSIGATTIGKTKIGQTIGSVAALQIGIFLSATISYLIGGAWTNVVQSDFDSVITSIQLSSSPESLIRYKESLQTAKQKNLRYAIWVTVVGIAVMILWTLFVQRFQKTSSS